MIVPSYYLLFFFCIVPNQLRLIAVIFLGTQIPTIGIQKASNDGYHAAMIATMGRAVSGAGASSAGPIWP